MEEKSLTKINNGLSEKISNFFKKIFRKKDKLNEYTTNTFNDEHKDFKKEIYIEEDKEEKYLLNLQNKIVNDEIDVDDISKDDYEKILALYDKQNEKFRQEIEMYKKKTAEIIKKIKNGE